ncbi:hypothetical protein ACF09H_29835 [Streptomyces sp. NPDC014983]|uniref:hypothetical protein n=1 Tax=Streptomyces sp. NPDC014983 TaxID=3364933 RepID=UPI0036F5AC8A
MPSPQVIFRAVPPLDERLEHRRTYPDIRNDVLTVAPEDAPKLGAVAARDLRVFYQLLDAELAIAARELTRDQVVMICDALAGVACDFRWVTAAPQMLAAEIADAYADDEDGPEEDRQHLAGRVAAWPSLRGYAVVEAAVEALRRSRAEPLDDALAAVGLRRRRRGHV